MGKKLLPTQDCVVHITTFGDLTVSNSLGTVREGHHKQGLPWLLLKYMVIHRERPVSLDELLGTIWPDNERAAAENAARVRLRRIREYIAPLALGGVDGLILFSSGTYCFNPYYKITMDVDMFTTFMAQICKTPIESPVGLTLCSDALNLIQGSYLEHTPNDAWIQPFRNYYNQEFRKLFREALDRSKATGTTEIISLLCQKSSLYAPNDEVFHKELIEYLVDQKQELDLVRHIATLARKGTDTAHWLCEFQ